MLNSSQNLILPAYLKQGDTIGITCPSGYLPMERVTFARQMLESKGYRVLMGSTVGSEHYYFSDNDERRCQDLQRMLDNPEVKAILMGRGGYGLSRIIDDLNFEQFCKQPKWICGFSDITVLHNHIQAQWGIATLHSPMCGAFKEERKADPDILSLLSALVGDDILYPISTHEFNRSGNAEGVLTGGNLAILAHLSGSASQVDTKGKILFLEDVGEYLYSTDRMLLNLKRSGLLHDLAGLICGGFTEMKDTDRPFGQSVYELIMDKVKEFSYPVCFDFPAGHQDINYTLKLGMRHTLNVTHESVALNLA